MNKLATVAGAAILSFSFIALGFAAQGQGDAGGASGQTSPSTSGSTEPSMGTDKGSQKDTGTTSKSKKKKEGETSSKSGTAPPTGGEGSNPTLDPKGKGSASGG